MNDERASDSYVLGYAEGVRDAVAWTGQHVATIQRLSAYVDGDDAPALRDAVRTFHDAVHRRWTQWSDRRNWPSVRALVAKSRAKAAGRGEAV